jgi:NADPH-dependent glutamate synthase beta subunit-like oxidoreductase
MDGCPNHNAIREMLMTISKAEEFEKTPEQAFEEAFHIFLETTPFPSVCGRVCPHPCESGCNRKEKEGAVDINAVERFIGDFGLEKGLKPSKLGESKSEKIAVIGSGPGGLTAAYQLARRGTRSPSSRPSQRPEACSGTGFPTTVCRPASWTRRSIGSWSSAWNCG